MVSEVKIPTNRTESSDMIPLAGMRPHLIEKSQFELITDQSIIIKG